MAALELFSTPLYDLASLKAYYRFEDNSNDAKGSNNGTDTAISYSAQKFNKGAVFNGISSRITIGNATALRFNRPFTVSAWVKTPAAAVGTIFHNGVWSFGMSANGKLFMYQAATGVVNSTGTINDGNLHLVQLVETSQTSRTFYIDGIASGTNTATGDADLTSTAINYIGSTPTPNEFWNGAIDDFAYFSEALTLSQILILNQGLPQSSAWFMFM